MTVYLEILWAQIAASIVLPLRSVAGVVEPEGIFRPGHSRHLMDSLKYVASCGKSIFAACIGNQKANITVRSTDNLAHQMRIGNSKFQGVPGQLDPCDDCEPPTCGVDGAGQDSEQAENNQA